MYCTRCGAQNTDGSRFCTTCGAAMSADAPPPPPGAGYYAGAASAAPPKRLRRIMADKKLGGVCAGFAEYFDMDVTLVRLIAVAALIIPPAPGLIIYLVAWMILPRD